MKQGLTAQGFFKEVQDICDTTPLYLLEVVDYMIRKKMYGKARSSFYGVHATSPQEEEFAATVVLLSDGATND